MEEFVADFYLPHRLVTNTEVLDVDGFSAIPIVYAKEIGVMEKIRKTSTGFLIWIV